MKKLIAMAALCMAGVVFAQEQEAAPAPEAAPEAPKCECGAGKPCECPKPCKCGGEEKKGPRGEFRRHGGMHGQRPGMRGPQGQGGRGMHRQMPKFKKCECCLECKGVIILPPDSQEGEPLFKLFKGEGNGPRPEMKRPQGQKPECGCAKPEAKEGCPCKKGPACDCPKPEGNIPQPPPAE